MTLEELRALLERQRAAYNAACEAVATAVDAVDALAADATQEHADPVFRALELADEEANRCKANLERTQKLIETRERHPVPAGGSGDDPEARGAGNPDVRVTSEETVYREDQGHSWFWDLLTRRENHEALERLRCNDNEMRARWERETRAGTDVKKRDLSQAAGAGGEFLPPNYLANLMVGVLRVGRNTADLFPRMPLPATGNTITIPVMATGSAVASQASDNAAVQETDPTSSSITGTVRTIAGQVDLSRQLIDRSEPGLDQWVMDDLVRDYDNKLGIQVVRGTGASGQHTGLRLVSGAVAISYTDATPTAAELIPKIYDAIQRAEAAGLGRPNVLVMHPRRAAWFASQLGATWPIFQITGVAPQSVGTQDGGFVTTIAGLRVVTDANILTNYGAGTNEDEMYVINTSESRLAEGPLQTRIFEEIGSGTLTIRFQVFGYSLFVANRRPAAITIISGTGLVAPTF